MLGQSHVPDVDEDVGALIRDEAPALHGVERLHRGLAAAAAHDTLHGPRASHDVCGLILARLLRAFLDVKGDCLALLRQAALAVRRVHEELRAVRGRDEAKIIHGVEALDRPGVRHGCPR